MSEWYECDIRLRKYITRRNSLSQSACGQTGKEISLSKNKKLHQGPPSISKKFSKKLRNRKPVYEPSRFFQLSYFFVLCFLMRQLIKELDNLYL